MGAVERAIDYCKLNLRTAVITLDGPVINWVNTIPKEMWSRRIPIKHFVATILQVGDPDRARVIRVNGHPTDPIEEAYPVTQIAEIEALARRSSSASLGRHKCIE